MDHLFIVWATWIANISIAFYCFRENPAISHRSPLLDLGALFRLL